MRGFSWQCDHGAVGPFRDLPFTAQLSLRIYLQASSPRRLEGFAICPRHLTSCVPAHDMRYTLVPDY